MKLSACLIILGAVLIAFWFFGVGGKIESTNAEKIKSLHKLRNRNVLIRLNGHQFREYVFNPRRNYTVVVMMTALESVHACHVCHYVLEEFKLVARSQFMSRNSLDKLFLVMVDYENGASVFKALGVQTVPAIIHFPPKERRMGDIMDVEKLGAAAETIAQFVKQRTGIKIPFDRSVTWMDLVGTTMLVGVVVVFLYLRGTTFDFLLNKQMLASLAAVYILALVSGQIWIYINQPPSLIKTANEGLTFIVPLPYQQSVTETYVVMFLLALIAFGLALLIEVGELEDPGPEDNANTLALIGLIVSWIALMILLILLRKKEPSYPHILELLLNLVSY